MAAKKTTKKIASQTPKTFTKSVQKPELSNASATSTTPVITAKNPKIQKPLLIILIVLLIIGVAFYFLRNWLVVAIVNGQPISRMDFQHQLEAQAGSQVLNALIAKNLILQEADRRHIVVTQADVDNRVKDFQKILSKQGQTLDQYLSFKKLSKQDFYDEVKVQQIIEKLLANDIKVSDKEITDYIDQNKDSLQGVNPSDLTQEVKQQLQSQKLQAKLPGFVQDLEKKAKINRLVNF